MTRPTSLTIVLALVVAPSISAAPPESGGWGHMGRVHAPPHEEAHDPPGDAVVLGRRTSSVAARVEFGPYVSVQVNVDEFGNNILGDAANEPTIAIDSTDPRRMAVGWRQFDTISTNFRQAGVAYSADGGASWVFPGPLDPGQFRSDPVLAADAAGNFFFSSLSSTTSVEVFRSSDGGVTWLPPVNAWGGDKQWLAVDARPSGLGAGNLYQTWNVQFTCCDASDFARSIDAGVTFQKPVSMPDPRLKWGTLDEGPDGTLYLAGSDLLQTGHLFTRSFNAKDLAEVPAFDPVRFVYLGGLTGAFGGADGPNPDGLLGQVWIAAHPTKLGRIYILGSVIREGIDPTDVMFVRTGDDGDHWTSPVRINDDALGNWQWFGTISVAPNGRIDVVWNDTRLLGDATMSAVFYSYSVDEGQSWSENEQLTPTFNSHEGFPNQNKIGDYYHMLSDNGGADLAFSATFNGEEDVYFLRIPRDCNGNGVDDDCDTTCGETGSRCDVPACGLSDDCNGNQVPDECEPDQDCNGNKIRDICEIGADSSLDCNSNGLLDACEDPSDCNGNKVSDICDVFLFGDCNANGVPDECDIAGLSSSDDDADGVPDECEGACCDCEACESLTEAECAFRNGDFDGLGTTCGVGSCVPPVFANDDCATSVDVPSAANVVVPFDNRCATTDGPATVFCPSEQPFAADVWYRYVAPCTGTIQIANCSAEYDGMLAVYGSSGDCFCPATNTSLRACGDDTCGIGGGPALVNVSVTAGRCYTVRVGGWDGAVGHGDLSLTYATACEPADVTGDGEINLADYARFERCFGPVSAGCESTDFDRSGAVDLLDYRAFFLGFED